MEWHGETPIYPPPKRRQSQLALAKNWTAAGLKDPTARPVFPDAVLEIKRSDGHPPRTFLLEHDRTRRVDKNFDKFRRYDNYLTTWYQDAGFARLGDEDPPYVLFICQDHEQRDLFITAADHELTGYRWDAAAPDQHQYLGRQRVLFATEIDIHQGRLEARRLAPNPLAEADNSRPDTEIRGVKLPGPLNDAQRETQQPSEQAIDPAESADTTPGREAA